MFGYNRKTEIKEIVSYKKEDFSKYEEPSERALYDEFLGNLKEGLNSSVNSYDSIKKFYRGALYAFSLSVVLYIILSFLVIVSNGGVI